MCECHCEDGDYGESWNTRCSACCPLVSICKSRSENAWGHHWLRWEGALVECESRILCRCPREACFALADSLVPPLPWALDCRRPFQHPVSTFLGAELLYTTSKKNKPPAQLGASGQQLSGPRWQLRASQPPSRTHLTPHAHGKRGIKGAKDQTVQKGGGPSSTY